MYLPILFSLAGVGTWLTTIATNWVTAYGYGAVFILMLLESASVPVPSEVVLPLAGLLASKGIMNFYLALAAASIGSIVGSLIDYSIGYYLGKEVIYKHLRLFHIKKEDLDGFDRWFEKNGVAAVFLTRFLPIIRTIINFPAGFAKMNLKKFLSYTIVGIVVWDAILMAFGYYLLSAKSAVVVLAGVSAFLIVLYIIYTVAIRKIRK